MMMMKLLQPRHLLLCCEFLPAAAIVSSLTALQRLLLRAVVELVEDCWIDQSGSEQSRSCKLRHLQQFWRVQYEQTCWTTPQTSAIEHAHISKLHDGFLLKAVLQLRTAVSTVAPTISAWLLACSQSSHLFMT